MSSAPTVSVHLLPELVPAGALAGGQAVVIDVLRATTVIVHALAAGCTAVVPCLEVEEARQQSLTLAPELVLLGGERQALPIEGFDLGNAPESYTPEVCHGKTLVMTTTNGTRAILSALEAERVLVAGFVNQLATCRALRADGRPVHLIASGTDRQISYEDALLAGAMAARLALLGFDSGNDEAVVMQRLWADVENQLDQDERRERQSSTASNPTAAECAPEPFESLVQAIGRWRGGRRLRQIGRWHDVRDAARIDRFDLVAELQRSPLRIVAVGRPEDRN